MHYLIYGVGAVGGMLGTRLALAGEDVTFLTRPAYAQQLARGLTVEQNNHAVTLQNPVIAGSLSDVSRRVDCLLLCVKLYDLESAIADIRLHTLPDTIVSFLNGVESEDELAGAFGGDVIIPATLTSAVSRQDPNTFLISRERGVGIAGSHPLASPLLASLTAAGFNTRHYKDGRQMKWSKLLSNITANATAAILGWSAGMVFSHPETYQLELAALREAIAVMGGLGLRVAPLPSLPLHLLPAALRLPDPILRPVLKRMVAGGRGGKPPSFSFDIARGRSEVRWLNGAVARFGQELGVDARVNRALTDILLDLVENRRLPASIQNQPEVLISLVETHANEMSLL